MDVPRTKMVNQIDHVIINKRHASSITVIKVCHGPNCDTDHFLVNVILRERLCNALKKQGRKRKRWNTDKLTKEKDLNLYQNKINEKLQNVNRTQDVQTEWNNIKNAIAEAAKETLSEKKGKRNEEWFNEDCRTVIQEKNTMRKIMLQRMTRSNKETY